MIKRQRAMVLVAIAALVVAGALVPRIFFSGSRRPAAPTGGSSAAVPVQVITVQPQTLTERLATTGTIRANEDVELVAEIAGKVAAIHFDEASRVAKGDLLLEIDDTQLRAEKERAAYRLKLAERREERQRNLLDEGLVSQDEYDYALNELNVLRAELELAEARLIKTRIEAPFEGIIGLRDVSLGSYLTPQTRIATLQDIDPVKIDFSVPEKYVRHLHKGGRVEFHTKGSDERHEGTIVAVEPLVDVDTRSLTLRAICPNPKGTLVPGAFADVELVVRSIDNALAVPSRAVVPELGGKKLFVLENGQAQPRPVETGLRTAELLEITSGLKPGDRVIVTAIQRLRAGVPVVVEGEER